MDKIPGAQFLAICYTISTTEAVFPKEVTCTCREKYDTRTRKLLLGSSTSQSRDQSQRNIGRDYLS